MKGLQSVIAEISSPDSFYFDGTGVLRRVTSSIFDDRGNVAQREALRKERHSRFRIRQAEAEARLAALRPRVGIDCCRGVWLMLLFSHPVLSPGCFRANCSGFLSPCHLEFSGVSIPRHTCTDSTRSYSISEGGKVGGLKMNILYMQKLSDKVD